MSDQRMNIYIYPPSLTLVHKSYSYTVYYRPHIQRKATKEKHTNLTDRKTPVLLRCTLTIHTCTLNDHKRLVLRSAYSTHRSMPTDTAAFFSGNKSLES